MHLFLNISISFQMEPRVMNFKQIYNLLYLDHLYEVIFSR